MKQIKGDLLEGDWDVACHVANSYCVMGSGIAYFLRKKWPEVYQADLDFDRMLVAAEGGPSDKLGYFSRAGLPDSRAVFNLYAMWGVGCDGRPLNRNCSYDALHNALYRMGEEIQSCHLLHDVVNVGVPKFMGCARAGGSWSIVEAILNEIEEQYPVIEFVTYELEEPEFKPQSSVIITD